MRFLNLYEYFYIKFRIIILYDIKTTKKKKPDAKSQRQGGSRRISRSLFFLRAEFLTLNSLFTETTGA